MLRLYHALFRVRLFITQPPPNYFLTKHVLWRILSARLGSPVGATAWTPLKQATMPLPFFTALARYLSAPTNMEWSEWIKRRFAWLSKKYTYLPTSQRAWVRYAPNLWCFLSSILYKRRLNSRLLTSSPVSFARSLQQLIQPRTWSFVRSGDVGTAWDYRHELQFRFSNIRFCHRRCGGPQHKSQQWLICYALIVSARLRYSTTTSTCRRKSWLSGVVNMRNTDEPVYEPPALRNTNGAVTN